MANLSQSCESKMWEVAYELRLRRLGLPMNFEDVALSSQPYRTFPNCRRQFFQWILDSVGQTRYKDTDSLGGDIMECLLIFHHVNFDLNSSSIVSRIKSRASKVSAQYSQSCDHMANHNFFSLEILYSSGSLIRLCLPNDHSRDSSTAAVGFVL
jgi:hypothetical protein